MTILQETPKWELDEAAVLSDVTDALDDYVGTFGPDEDYSLKIEAVSEIKGQVGPVLRMSDGSHWRVRVEKIS